MGAKLKALPVPQGSLAIPEDGPPIGRQFQCANIVACGTGFFGLCNVTDRGSLAVAEGGDSGEGFAFEELEGGASTGGAVGDLVGNAEFFGGSGSVASADDGDGS